MRWISVKDRLPEDMGRVLAFDGCESYIAWHVSLMTVGGPSNAWYEAQFECINDDCTYVKDYCSCVTCREPTHWMPLPPEPKESKDIMRHATFLKPEHFIDACPCPCSDCRAGLDGGPVHDWVQEIIAATRKESKESDDNESI